MKHLDEHLALIAVTLWVGGLWTLGPVAAPVLFGNLADKQLAGMLAGKMFTILAYIGMACGGYLTLHRLTKAGGKAFTHLFFWVTVLMLALTLGGHFGIQPILDFLKREALPQAVMDSVFAERFSRWHGISTVLYYVQCLLGLVLVLKSRRTK